MPDELPASPPSPRLQGLNPAAVAGVLSHPRCATPEIPGWEISGPLGEGGLGTVWKARRTSDGTMAAIKLPLADDVALVERLEVEAGTLRALDHPNIVRLLESGPLENGGLYLAMEFVDGPTLSHALPPAGFPAARAYDLFRQIASAMAHAHSRGVLHRDLKPGNILLDASGTVRVADFGLAHSVSGRVKRLSLTLTGLIAGTAEYLPPEAYRAGYEPDISADIYALGVILYELLTGHPPRGAWQAVSLQNKDVDIRVDDLLRRTLAPHPDKRFSSAQALLDALEHILRSPARYAGTPRVTRAIRLLDAMWTLAGLVLLLAATGTFCQVEKWAMHWPIDLIGTNPLMMGGFQAMVFLLLVAGPMGLWQLVRLWRFRRVPLRESLPCPGGMRLGSSASAAWAVTTGQVLLVLLPCFLMLRIWKDSCTAWLLPDSPPWAQGLVITGRGEKGLTWVHPWQWPVPDFQCALWERAGWVGDPLGSGVDNTNITPFWIPLLMSVCAGLHLLSITGAAAAGSVKWWRRGRRGRALLLGTATLGTPAAILWNDPALIPRVTARSVPDNIRDGTHSGFLTRQILKVREIHRLLFPGPPPRWTDPPAELVRLYQPDKIDFRSLGEEVTREQVMQQYAAEAAAARLNNRTTTLLESGERFRSTRFPRLFEHYAVMENRTDPPGGLSTGALLHFYQQGHTDAKAIIQITMERLGAFPLYQAERRSLSSGEALAWSQRLLAALAAPSTGSDPLRSTADPLTALFLPELMQPNTPRHGFTPSSFTPQDRTSLFAALRATLPGGTPPALDGPIPPAESLPGARQRIRIPVRHSSSGAAGVWITDLAHVDGRWQCVRFVFAD